MQNPHTLWDIITASDFEVPVAPSHEAARSQSRRFWRWFKHKLLRLPEKDTSSESTQLQLLADDQVESATPKPEWSQVAEAVVANLSEWFDASRSNRHSVFTLIGPPGSDVASVICALARERNLKIFPAPPSNATLDDFDPEKYDLRAVNESVDDILVIPHLERYFLRHEDGLALVRNLTQRLMTRRVLLGCDSWAWAFLQQAIGIEDLLGKPRTLAPFDAQRLDAWFRSSAEFEINKFRRSESDELVFPDRSGERAGKQEQLEATAVIKSLAARARGNLGVALALWRASLRKDAPKSDESAPAEQPTGNLFWVVSPSDLTLPQVQGGIKQLHRFILHTLLLHAGLPLSTLTSLLPFAREEVCSCVSELRFAGVIDEQNEILRVTLTAYPKVRQDLIGDGFLADAF